MSFVHVGRNLIQTEQNQQRPTIVKYLFACPFYMRMPREHSHEQLSCQIREKGFSWKKSTDFVEGR